ncbi:hypothetical protein ACWIYZ_02125 [Ursidibacter arcticus]
MKNNTDLVPSLEHIDYGKQKKDGSHDHRYNTGKDRTPKQKESDKKKRKQP